MRLATRRGVHLCIVVTGLSASCAHAAVRAETRPPGAQCSPPLAEHLKTSLYFDRANTRDPMRPNGTVFRGIGRTLVVLAPIAVMDAIKNLYGHQLVIREETRVCAEF